MREFYYRIVEFLDNVEVFLKKSNYHRVVNKKYYTEPEIASFFGRSTRWVYERLRKGGVLMKGVHFFEVCGVILYDLERIEADIASGSIK